MWIIAVRYIPGPVLIDVCTTFGRAGLLGGQIGWHSPPQFHPAAKHWFKQRNEDWIYTQIYHFHMRTNINMRREIHSECKRAWYRHWKQRPPTCTCNYVARSNESRRVDGPVWTGLGRLLRWTHCPFEEDRKEEQRRRLYLLACLVIFFFNATTNEFKLVLGHFICQFFENVITEDQRGVEKKLIGCLS